MPSVSEKQHNAMEAAAHGHSTLGIPESVGKEFVRADDEPTDAQIAAGNYAKMHISFGGIPIAIETPKGGTRRGTDADGKAWSVEMPADYGYIKRTTGADDEQVDCYVGPDAESADVWVIDQIDLATGAFDEHKVMLGFASEPDAVATYQAAFSDGRGAARIGRVARTSLKEFRAELAESRGTCFRGDAVETLESRLAAGRSAAPGTDDVAGEGERYGLTDHETALAMRDGILSSPQRYGDFWLFDLRITGTGMAYRNSIDEWAFRDPALWLTDEFVERCNGLPVIFGHPERSGLNSDEFQERAIGSIVLPYIKGDEVWGVAKIFSSDAAVAMQSTHRSTSPGVTPPKGSSPVLLEYGTDAKENGSDAQFEAKVLAEGLPLILDHLAVCEAGVWDKDGPPEGIRLDSQTRKDTDVADEELQAKLDAAIAERDDAKAKLDAKEAEEDKAREDKKRRDAMELDAKRKDGESEEDYEKRMDAKLDSESDEEFEERKKDRKAKKDAANAKREEVEANRGTEIHDAKVLAKLDEVLADNKQLRSQIAALTTQPSIEDANEIARAWGRWDSLYQALGEQTPQAYPGEKPRAYLRRLADGTRKFTKSFQNYVFHDSQQTIDFDLVTEKIFDEAAAYAKNPPADATRNDEREIVTVKHGKTRTEFQGGDPFAPFKHPRKFAVTAIVNPNRGNVYAS